MLKGLNTFMHPRNPYKIPPNFKELAEKYPEFKAIACQETNGKVSLDFKNPEGLRILTKTLLKNDFSLDVEIPADRLVPTLSSRLNYILWIQDLITFSELPVNELIGIDIGTGASCVYPLLGCKLNGWKFIATETDSKSIECCRRNIQVNRMEENILLIPVEENSILLDAVSKSNNSNFTFCMCNPPFFSSMDEALSNHKTTNTPPSATNTASEKEMVTKGGEIEFVQKIINDSLKLKKTIVLYTTMLGKKSSLKIIKKELSNHNITHITTAQLCQGKTMRWVIAWTFHDNIPLEKMATTKATSKPLEYLIPSSILSSIEEASLKIHQLLDELSIRFTEYNRTQKSTKFDFVAKENTWIHQRRKRRKEKFQNNNNDQKTFTKSEDINLPNNNKTKRKLQTTNVEDEAQEAKKAKVEIQSSSQSSLNALEGKLILKREKSNISLQLHFIYGSIGRNGLYQLLQFLKNRLK